MSHDVEPVDLIVQLQDGTRVTLQRDTGDRLVTQAFQTGSAKYAEGALTPGMLVLGFGAWPSWTTNLMSGIATLPDEASGLFEPERLFVLREQYLFVENPAGGKALSFGPIHKAWWAGTEHVVQARHMSGRH